MLRKLYFRRPLPPKPKLKRLPSFAISSTSIASKLLISSHSPDAISPSSRLRVRSSRRNFKLILCRVQLQWLTCLNAGLSLALLFLTFWVEATESVAALTLVAIFSLIQVWLVVMYWSRKSQFEEWTNRAIESKRDFKPIERHILICVVESAFHLIIPFPNELYIGKVQLSSLINLMIWCRNYHIFRMLFWTSELSGLRAHVLAATNGVKMDWSLTFKYFAWNKSGLVASLIILQAGLLLAVCLDVEMTYSGLTTLFRIGLIPPSSSAWYGQLMLLLTVGFGVYVAGLVVMLMRGIARLTAKEEQLSTALELSARAGRLQSRATTLLQAWWRLQLMRRRHKFNLFTVFTWYRSLLAYPHLGVYTCSLSQYSLPTHLASIQHRVHRRVRTTVIHFDIDLDLLSRQALAILEKAQAMAGVRKLAILSERLSTIMEDLNEQVQSPALSHYTGEEIM